MKSIRDFHFPTSLVPNSTIMTKSDFFGISFTSSFLPFFLSLSLFPKLLKPSRLVEEEKERL